MASRRRSVAALVLSVASLAACSASGHAHEAGNQHASPRPTPAVALSTMPLTATDLPTPGATPAQAAPDPSGDARVRTLLTWCTHTAVTEDAASTAYGPTITIKGPHGPNTLYSYTRALPQGTASDASLYAARLVTCWRSALLPVFAATLDVHIDHLTFASSTAALPLTAPSYGHALAVEGVIRWHPTPATTEASVYDVAVLFGSRTETTILAAGADGLTTGLQHISRDVDAVADRTRAAETGTSPSPPPSEHRPTR